MAERTPRYAIPPEIDAMEARGHQVVEASAGTGKTYLIERRVVDLLLATDATIDQILVVTFTEKATAELRMRIRRLLEAVLESEDEATTEGEPVWLLDSAAKQKLANALYGFDRAAVHTIHAFCQRVLTENAFENRRLFEQSQVTREIAFESAFKAVLRERLARDPEQATYLAAWLNSGGSVATLEKLLFDCSKQNGTLVPAFDAAMFAGQLTAAADQILAVDDKALLAALKATGMNASSAKAAVGRVGKLAEMLADYQASGDLPAFLARVATARAGNAKVSFLQYLRNVGDAQIEDAKLRAAARRIGDVASAVVPFEAALAQQFLPPVLDRMQRDKERFGQFDFDDMLALVWKSLDGPAGPALASRLRARYRFALIDEFQDTDDLQWKIFRRLYVEGGGTNFLTIIGDPKQAIYGFRGADVFTYFEARREMIEAGAQETSLDASYRSTPAIMAANNRLFLDHVEGGFFTGQCAYPTPIRAGKDLVSVHAAGGDDVPVQIVQAVPNAEGKMSADQQRSAHASFIRDEIRALLFDPLRRLEVGPPGELHPVEPADIFVLTRTGRECSIIAEALRAAAIPCAMYKQEGLFQTREAEDVRDLLTALAEPRSRSARLRAFATRFFGVPMADLARYRDLADTHPLVTRLLDWRAVADRHSYEVLFNHIVAQSGLIERELFGESSERALTNYLHLFELLLEEASSSRCDLGELVQRLQQWIDHPGSGAGADSDVQRLESDRSAVQLMTIHKAKGLEAKVVFLFGSFSAPRTGQVHVYHRGGQRQVHIGKLDADAKRLVEREAEQENQRLLYVALTRAVARLYLPYVDPAQLKQPPKGCLAQLNSRLGPIAAALASGDADAEIAQTFGLLQAFPESPAGPDVGSFAGADAEATPGRWEPPDELLEVPAPDPSYARLRDQRRGLVITSYSRLRSQTYELAPIEEREPDEDLDRAAAARSDDLPGGVETGIFLHEILERLDYASVRNTPDFEAWRQRAEIAKLFGDGMLGHDLDPAHLERAQRIVFRSLSAPVLAGDVEIPSLAACERGMKEVEFLYPLPPGARQGFLKGFIDLVFEFQGRVYLLDWKSDVLPGYSAAALREHVEQSYALQAHLYALAVAKMLRVETAEQHEARFGGFLFCFLRGTTADEPASSGFYFDRPTFADLHGYEADLARLGREAW